MNKRKPKRRGKPKIKMGTIYPKSLYLNKGQKPITNNYKEVKLK